MSFPNSPDKYKFPGVLSPANLISQRGKDGKEELRGAASAILCFDSSSFKYLSRNFGGRKAEGFTGNAVTLRKTGYKIAAAQTRGLGAPAVAVMLEELATGGITRCIAIGVAGTLQDSIATGDLIITTEAIRDEGTSYHYLPADLPASPSKELFQQLVVGLSHRNQKYLSGRVWTTDAPYRETAEEIIRYQQNGILAVDMETSAFLSVCTALKIEAASGLIAADSLAGAAWRPPTDRKKVDISLRRLAVAAVETLTV